MGFQAAFMHMAIEMARGQMGKTYPNPPVGCVIVKDNQVIAKGATADGGQRHAEEVTLALAAETAVGADVYVTLEPCAHRSKGGVSCSQHLIKARVARVYYGCNDPFFHGVSHGFEAFEAAGIAIELSDMAKDCEPLIDGFAHWLKTGLPLVVISETGLGCDAEFIDEPSQDRLVALKKAGEMGYRKLWVKPDSAYAQTLMTTI